MSDKTAELKVLFEEKIKEAQSSVDIDKLRVEFLGKKGKISALMGELKNIPNDLHIQQPAQIFFKQDAVLLRYTGLF